LLQLDSLQRHERNYVCRADARMDALLARQVDGLRRLARGPHRRFHNCGWLSGNRHHRAVMIRVHRPIEQMHAIHPHGGHNRLHTGGVSPL
jgi:hypothetical protein